MSAVIYVQADQETQELFKLVLENKLPEDFCEWWLSDSSGFTLAHAYAKMHMFPADFPHWGLKDKDGWSVAHTAAYHGTLPPKFNNWFLETNEGVTVAELAICRKHIPEGETLRTLLFKWNQYLESKDSK